ncbi:MAG: homoserine dehydrogenase [Candidatus Sumerlaeia bacterium]|nr:homoserine dehydrogenase [Candidatus Sumerlaeia bacterium]
MRYTFAEKRSLTGEQPIRVGIIGLGRMGSGLLFQTHHTRDIFCGVGADLDLPKAEKILQEFGIPYEICDSPEDVLRVIGSGKFALCEEGRLVAECPEIDVLLESSTAILEGLEFCEAALQSGHHLVLMNSEVDLAFGPYLYKQAEQLGLTYTSCDGDQHGVLIRVIREIQDWGFDLVMAGNIKGFLNRRANPVSIVPEADKRSLSYSMCTAFTDGTKLNIEMALLSNALGLKTPVPGMIGPRAQNVQQALSLFNLEELHANHPEGVVDYLLGAQPDGGVFVVGKQTHPFQSNLLHYYKMGKGPYYVFYRPYHLCHVEAMRCIREAIQGEPLLAPLKGYQTNVFAYAKKPLQPGDILDGIGGHCAYGMIENIRSGERPSGVPICLSEGVVLRNAVEQDQPIGIQNVVIPENRRDWSLNRGA